MSDFSQLLQLGQQMQGRITQMQTELTQRTVTGTSGGGMVTVTADGKGQVRSVKIDKSIVEDGDVEMIEELVTAAVSDDQRRAEEMYRDELRKVTWALQLPFQ